MIELGRILDPPDESPPPGHPILGGGETKDSILLFHYSRTLWRGDLDRLSEVVSTRCTTRDEAVEATGIPLTRYENVLARKLWVSRRAMSEWFCNEVTPSQSLSSTQFTLLKLIPSKYLLDGPLLT